MHKNFKYTILGVATLLFALTLNFRHALDDYGVLENKLHMEVLAQSSTTDGGGTTEGGSTTDGGGTTPSCPEGTSYHAGAIDEYVECTVTETRTCHIGGTIPDWIPYVGGITCEFTVDYPLSFAGTQNSCIQTGVESQYCCSFSCKKN